MANTPSSSKIAELARRCFETYQTKDRATLEQLLAPEFRFTSPYDDHIDRATYFERCWPNAGSYDRFEIEHLVVHGDRAWVTYTGHGKRWFRNTEILRFAGEQLVEVEVFFGLPPHTAPEVPEA